MYIQNKTKSRVSFAKLKKKCFTIKMKDVQQTQFRCIAGGEEGRMGGGYLCKATPSPSPSPVTHAQTACLLSIRPFCAIVLLNLVLYFVSYSVLIPFTSNTFQQFSFNSPFPYLKMISNQIKMISTRATFVVTF